MLYCLFKMDETGEFWTQLGSWYEIYEIVTKALEHEKKLNPDSVLKIGSIDIISTNCGKVDTSLAYTSDASLPPIKAS